MKKNLTEIVFILDRSGSMAGLEEDLARPSFPLSFLTMNAKSSTTA